MTATSTGASDSRPLRGGFIPGLAGLPAFTVRAPDPSLVPILIAAPHGGRSYSDGLLHAMRAPDESPLRLEDRLIDMVAQRVSDATGAGLLLAHAPRAMIDLNRSLEDMDWTMVAGRSVALGKGRPLIGQRARSGLGLVPRRLSGLGEIWRGPIRSEDLDLRIAGIHRPYHDALAARLRALRDQWGCALLVDLHSMPPLAADGGSGAAPEFVIGDRFGASCDATFAASVIDHIAGEGRLVAHNRPYAGGFVLDRHSAPGRGLHALQLEICRSAYLDPELREIGTGFESVVSLLVRLVRRLALELAEAGRAEIWPQAAE